MFMFVSYFNQNFSCIFVWNIGEIPVASSSCRSISAPASRTNDCIVVEKVETISQTSNLNEAHQPQTNGQQSFRASSQSGLISNESESSDSQLPSFIDKEAIDNTISPQDNDSVFSYEDDNETADNIVNSTIEMNSFLNENYNHEHSTIDATDTSETSKPLLQRQDSISSRFLSLSKLIITPDISSTPIDTTQEQVPIFIPTSENKPSQTINNTQTKRVSPKLSTSPNTFKKPGVPNFKPKPSSSTSSVKDSQIRRVASATKIETRTMTTSKTLKDSCSTQNLTLFATDMQQSESETSHNITISHVTQGTLSLAAASNVEPSLDESRLPSHELDHKTNDQMPQLTQDFYRPTVELYLESSSTSLNENFIATETTNSLQTCTLTDNDKKSTVIEVQQNLSTPDLQKIQQEQETTSSSSADLKINNVKHNFSDSIINDRRMPIVQHVVNNLRKYLDELKNLYASVAQSSDPQDVMLKEHIEQIYNDLRLLITNEQ
ncbi:unnamed protein product [Rotaria sp. Silwood1]|nr:unnamed protein product [Rotaria sp. Silwood1]